MVYPDGRQVRQPKALCELQGYVFDAWMRTGELFDALGEAARARELRRRAVELQDRFEERFWCEGIGFYAYALDPDKQPVRTIASNPGHCLWSGLIRPDRAARVVERLVQPDMWSGWGIRTLSRRNPVYNPFSYQRGSVWPHDNGIIALGSSGTVLRRRPRGLRETFQKPRAISSAIACPSYMRASSGGLVCFRWRIQAPMCPRPGPRDRCSISCRRSLAWRRTRRTDDCTLIRCSRRGSLMSPCGGRIGGARVTLRFWRDGEKTLWEPASIDGRIEIQQRSWRPWMTADREQIPAWAESGHDRGASC